MRTTTTIFVVFTLSILIQADAFGQCQRGGGGGGMNRQRAFMSTQTGGFPQAVANPVFAMQQAAMQQAVRQQQFRAQQMQMQQVALREQARRDQLASRRSAAQQRRSAELARREEIRAANFAKLKARDSQETLVALSGN